MHEQTEVRLVELAWNFALARAGKAGEYSNKKPLEVFDEVYKSMSKTISKAIRTR